MTTVTPMIFGQIKPSTPTPTAVYTVPQGAQAQLTLFVYNQGSGFDNFRIALVPNGQTITTARYLAYDTPLINNGVFALAGIGLNSGDTVFVQSANGGVSFTATGMQYSS
jgi:hypothetical protein